MQRIYELADISQCLQRVEYNMVLPTSKQPPKLWETPRKVPHRLCMAGLEEVSLASNISEGYKVTKLCPSGPLEPSVQHGKSFGGAMIVNLGEGKMLQSQ